MIKYRTIFKTVVYVSKSNRFKKLFSEHLRNVPFFYVLRTFTKSKNVLQSFLKRNIHPSPVFAFLSQYVCHIVHHIVKTHNIASILWLYNDRIVTILSTYLTIFHNMLTILTWYCDNIVAISWGFWNMVTICWKICLTYCRYCDENREGRSGTCLHIYLYVYMFIYICLLKNVINLQDIKVGIEYFENTKHAKKFFDG